MNGQSRRHTRRDLSEIDGPRGENELVVPICQSLVRFKTRPRMHAHIPQCDHLVRIDAQRHAEGARESEIRNLERAVPINEQIVRLQISVQHAVRVAKGDAAQQLVQVGADERRRHRVGDVVEVAPQVLLDELCVCVRARGGGVNVSDDAVTYRWS